MRFVAAKSIVLLALLLPFGWQVEALAGGPKRGRNRQVKPKVSKTRALIGKTGRHEQLRCHSIPAFYWRLTPKLTDVRQPTTNAWLRSPLMKKLKGKEPNSIVEVYDRAMIKTDYHTAVVTSEGTVIEKRTKRSTDRIEEISWKEFKNRYSDLPTAFYRPTLSIDDFIEENQLDNTYAEQVLDRIESWESRISPYLLLDPSRSPPATPFEDIHNEVFDLLISKLEGDRQALSGKKFSSMTPDELLRAFNLTRLITLRDLTDPY